MFRTTRKVNTSKLQTWMLFYVNWHTLSFTLTQLLLSIYNRYIWCTIIYLFIFIRQSMFTVWSITRRNQINLRYTEVSYTHLTLSMVKQIFPVQKPLYELVFSTFRGIERKFFFCKACYEFNSWLRSHKFQSISHINKDKLNSNLYVPQFNITANTQILQKYLLIKVHKKTYLLIKRFGISLLCIKYFFLISVTFIIFYFTRRITSVMVTIPPCIRQLYTYSLLERSKTVFISNKVHQFSTCNIKTSEYKCSAILYLYEFYHSISC